jgi:hypothetical protein
VQHRVQCSALEKRLVGGGSDTLPVVRKRELVKSVLQSNKLGIIISSHEVHLFAGLPLTTHEAENEAAPQGAQPSQIDRSHLDISSSAVPGLAVLFGTGCIQTAPLRFQSASVGGFIPAQNARRSRGWGALRC